VTDFSGQNAGHAVAARADLGAFQWLESEGLDRNAFAQRIWPSTYAHMVGGLSASDKDDVKRAAFAKYLAHKEYPIDLPGRDGTTPAECAISEGRTGVGLAYIDAGAAPNPAYLATVIGQTHFNKTTVADIIAVGDKLQKKGALNADALLAAYGKLFDIVRMNDKNLRQGKDIAAYLKGKGMTPQQAAAKLGRADELAQVAQALAAPSPRGWLCRLLPGGSKP
jgi:hypothetical protein